MASSSSISPKAQNIKSSSALLRSILVNVKAQESDTPNDELSYSDNKATAAEQDRQATESAPLLK
ncbi:hypothetical protein BT96DRAFT_998715 [Gymnopus androsaceus JB14]|uniref:Uncharacterized protein n=1 Tax=Gymnopus androsaceus JB14 TaxID=1447944 RepID=A0A6A4H934_9AGAR|nr:hypothetical protein BT96DRAFT_998715 [Gymnopus androsaceus JB14]